MFKLSKYNVASQSNGKAYIFNALLRTFTAIDTKLYNQLISGDFDTISKDEESLLIKSGIILDAEIDERFVLIDTLNKARFRNDTLCLFISMTSNCNLSCPYCYQDCRKETKEKKYIDKETVDKYVEFIANSLATKIDIVYFGGEPTLNDNILTYAIEKINSIDGKIVRNTLITNGFNISDKLIKIAHDVKNFFIQVTLDGNREYHDNLRKTHKNEPTYDVIMNNVNRIIMLMPGKVSVRINVSSNDFCMYKTVVDDISERFGDKVLVSFAAIFDGQKKENNNCLESEADILELYEYARHKGYDSIPSIEFSPCVANTLNAFAFDEKCNIYSCPERLYESSVGFISDTSEVIITNNEWYKNLYEIKSCVDNCLFGGLCFGGCMMHKNKCRKNTFEKLLPYIISKKIEQYERRAKA